MLFNLLDMAQTPRAQALPFPPPCAGTAESQDTQGTGTTQGKLQPSAKRDEKLHHEPRSFISVVHSCAQIEATNPCASALL